MFYHAYHIQYSLSCAYVTITIDQWVIFQDLAVPVKDRGTRLRL